MHLKMMNCVLKMMNFVLNMTILGIKQRRSRDVRGGDAYSIKNDYFLLKLMNFVLKMTNFGAGRHERWVSPRPAPPRRNRLARPLLLRYM